MMKRLSAIVGLVLVAAVVYFAFNPMHLYVNDTDQHIAGYVQQAGSPSCELDLPPGAKKLDMVCSHPEVFYGHNEEVWFQKDWQSQNFLVAKVIRFSRANETFAPTQDNP